MKKTILLFLLIFTIVQTNNLFANYKSSTPIIGNTILKTKDTAKSPLDSTSSKKENLKEKNEVKKSKDEDSNTNESNESENKSKIKMSELSIEIICVLFFIVMLFLLYKYFEYIEKRNQRIGFQSIKLIGLVLIFPGICIIALVGGDLIPGSTLAALLGTIAGYVLSRDDDSNADNLKSKIATLDIEKQDLIAKNKQTLEESKALKAEIEKANEEITELKKKIN